MQPATANGTTAERKREQPQITDNSPKVATNSLKTSDHPPRACEESEYKRRPNIRWAIPAPVIPPAHCAMTYVGTSRNSMLNCVRECHRWIEVCARNWAECQN